MNRFTLVGYDANPSRAFDHLSHIIASKNDDVVWKWAFHGGKSQEFKEVKERFSEAIKNSDAVLLGMSFPADNAAAELYAAELAIQHGKPFGFFSDAHGAWKRAWFEPFRSQASFLCVVNESEKEEATAYFPNAKIFVTGNPLWADYFAVKDRARSRWLVGAGDDSIIVLIPGTKDAAMNIVQWTGCIDAASFSYDRYDTFAVKQRRRSYRIILARHPGDKTDSTAYQSLVKYGNKLMGVEVVIPESGITTDSLVPGADIVVNGVSVRIHALAQLVPCVDFYGRLSQELLFEDMRSRKTYFAGTGAIKEVYDGSYTSLANAYRDVLRDPHHMRAAQKNMVPPLAPGDAERKMYEALKKSTQT